MELFKVSKRENFRAKILSQVTEGLIAREEASERIGLSLRQLDRLRSKYQKGGVISIIHGNRGKLSNNAMAKEELVR